MSRATTKTEVAIATDWAPKSVSRPVTVSDNDIARRAYDLYLARGREDGHDVEDWLQAERELRVDAEC